MLWHEQLMRQQGGVAPLLPQGSQAVLDLLLELRSALGRSGLPSYHPPSSYYATPELDS